jgi:anti-sigma regulatory factor (Ser/Thr protein kinase)
MRVRATTVRDTASVVVPHDARSASVARHHLCRDMSAHSVDDGLANDAELLLSELVGNAVRHARPLPGGVVRVAWEIASREVVLLRVTDGGSPNGHRPQASVAGPDAVSGRGLAIVAAVAARWGVEPARGGQSVWAVLGAT